jgi:hypothetical protein
MNADPDLNKMNADPDLHKMNADPDLHTMNADPCNERKVAETSGQSGWRLVRAALCRA